jgi:hypothetical protein
MTRRTRDLLLLVILSILVNGLVALAVTSPGYVDAYYYFNGGVFIVQKQPLLEPYLWNYVNPPPALPAPAFGYWQPLPSFITALGIILFGRAAPFGSAQAAFVLLITVLPLIGYLLGEQTGGRRSALLAGLLTIFSGYYVIYWSLPESFTPFAVSGAGALALAGLARRKGTWWPWPLAGACAALGHLTRADGLLLAGIVSLVALIPHKEPGNPPRHPADRAIPRITHAALAALGYLIVMAPWFVRNLAAFGSPLPPGGLDTLWLLEHNDLFTYPPRLSPARYFAAGWPVILRGKLRALGGNLATFVGVQNVIVLTPFTLVGLWRRWREDWLLPAALYEVVLFLAMTFAFTFPGVGGGYFHSGGALMPFFATAAALGLDDTLRWAARRRGTWRFEQTSRVFGVALVTFAAALTVYVVVNRIVGLPAMTTIAWNTADDVYDVIGAKLDALGVPPDAPVMSNNTPGFYTHTGHGGVPLPNGDEAALLQAADAYHIAYLVVDSEVADDLVSLYENGPTSERFVLVDTYPGPGGTTYLYHITPPGK